MLRCLCCDYSKTLDDANKLTTMTDEEIYRLVRDTYNEVNKGYIEEQIRIAKESAGNKST